VCIGKGQKSENTSGVTIFECKHVWSVCEVLPLTFFLFLFCSALKMCHKSDST
jgi:hypothetical protein